MKVILAGNYDEFINCCVENKLRSDDCIYLDRPFKIFGLYLNKDDVIHYGTWKQRENAYRLENEILTRLEITRVRKEKI